MRSPTRSLTPKMLDAFMRVRLDGKLEAYAYRALQSYLQGLLEERAFPPYRGRWIDADAMAVETGIAHRILADIRPHLQPLCDAISRAAADPARGRKERPAMPEPPPKPRGRPRRPVEIGSPKPLWTVWADPEAFSAALRLHMACHGDSLRALHAALAAGGTAPCFSTLALWHRDAAKPSAGSIPALAAIERRYGLPAGYFDAKDERRSRVKTNRGGFVTIPYAERRRLAWHLPTDFAQRPAAEQEEIIAWVREVVISGSTDYRRYQAAATKQRYALRFPGLKLAHSGGRAAAVDAARHSTLTDAPERLRRDMAELLHFKTSTLTALGLRRNGV